MRPLGRGDARQELGGGAVAPIQRERLARLLRRFVVAARFERCARLAIETRHLRGDLGWQLAMTRREASGADGEAWDRDVRRLVPAARAVPGRFRALGQLRPLRSPAGGDGLGAGGGTAGAADGALDCRGWGWLRRSIAKDE